MREFASLLEKLVFMPSRNGKIRVLKEYFEVTPDPERGWALAALTGALDLIHIKSSAVKDMAKNRLDPVLFEYSYDYVGDLAETVSLIWPDKDDETPGHVPDNPDLGTVIHTLNSASKKQAIALFADYLDIFGIKERFALIKLTGGGLRVGVSERLCKVALAEYGDKSVEDIEEVWHTLDPPYVDMFGWLDNILQKPAIHDKPYFRPLMLATPFEDATLENLDPGDFLAEWKWDGIRVQLVSVNGATRLYSRTGEDISATFPDLLHGIEFESVLDGELVVMQNNEVQSFNSLQQRLNRKTVSKKLLTESPAYLKVYDILLSGRTDTRTVPFLERRQILESWMENNRQYPRLSLSPLVEFRHWKDLKEKKEKIREVPGHLHVEGVMIKRKDSLYVPGRPKGPWYKWKRTPPTLDCVMMYAQRGHGKRSSYYSDFTFGCWRTDENGARELVPVGKAYFGFTDQELRALDKWVRNNTIATYGPVREVKKECVLEIAFDSIHRSKRHKSGLAMRFPRISRIRYDKLAYEANTVLDAENLLLE